MSIMDDLPEELLELIFESMDIVTLVRSMQVGYCQITPINMLSAAGLPEI